MNKDLENKVVVPVSCKLRKETLFRDKQVTVERVTVRWNICWKYLHLPYLFFFVHQPRLKNSAVVLKGTLTLYLCCPIHQGTKVCFLNRILHAAIDTKMSLTQVVSIPWHWRVIIARMTTVFGTNGKRLAVENSTLRWKHCEGLPPLVGTLEHLRAVPYSSDLCESSHYTFPQG